MKRLLWLPCPECYESQMLGCEVAGTREQFEVTLVEQVCLCDPYGAWEDVCEAARDRVCEEYDVD